VDFGMTARRCTIEKSLAERGRPAMWANEQEAAFLSGVNPGLFKSKVEDWEKDGFPPINPKNGKRPIPYILAYWNLPLSHMGQIFQTESRLAAEDQEGQETW
jgi:hypothetical protein